MGDRDSLYPNHLGTTQDVISHTTKNRGTLAQARHSKGLLHIGAGY